MRLRLHTVVETREFQHSIVGLLVQEECEALIGYLAANPNAGDLIRGTGDARKLRWARRGRGKSGGARVITYCAGPHLPVFLLSAYGKGAKGDLSGAERNELRSVLGRLAAEYRKGYARHVESRRKHH